MSDLATWLDKIVNFSIPFGRWQLSEFSDLSIVPPFVKHDQQDALTARWTKRIPVLQNSSPAELAADIVHECLESFPDVDARSWSVIDFGSGSGGPVPLIEKFVNLARERIGKKPIPFQLSDLNPNLNLDKWMVHSSGSRNLGFIPDPVDATNPTFSVISTTTKGDQEAARQVGLEWNGNKVFRLYSTTFHHWDDATAARALKSTMETSDGFAIIELQERRVFSFLFVLLEACLLMLMALLWFWRDPAHLLLTYLLPILPLTQCLDGWVSCLRSRNFEEILRLVSSAHGHKESVEVQGGGEMARFRDWEFKHTRVLHTWPIGYMNVVTGRCVLP